MSHPNNNAALVRSTSDPEQVARARESEEQRRGREDGELRQVLTTYVGRSVAWRLLERCGIYELSFSSDPHNTAFREGNRNVGLAFLSDIMRVAPDAYAQMQRENQARKAAQRDVRKPRKPQRSGEPARPVLVETEDTVEGDDGN